MPQTESKDVRSSEARIDAPRGNSNRIREAELGAAMQFLALALRMASTYDPAQPDHGRGSVRTALVGVIRLDSRALSSRTSIADLSQSPVVRTLGLRSRKGGTAS